MASKTERQAAGLITDSAAEVLITDAVTHMRIAVKTLCDALDPLSREQIGQPTERLIDDIMTLQDTADDIIKETEHK